MNRNSLFKRGTRWKVRDGAAGLDLWFSLFLITMPFRFMTDGSQENGLCIAPGEERVTVSV